MASAIASCRTLENFSGENQNADSVDRFADGFMHWVYRSSLSNAFVAMVNDFTFCGFICLANDTDWSVAWSQNARADMDQRDHANQAGSTGHDHFIWWSCIYGTVVCRIYASGWMFGFCGYISCFVVANLFLSVLAYLWLREKGVTLFAAL